MTWCPADLGSNLNTAWCWLYYNLRLFLEPIVLTSTFEGFCEDSVRECLRHLENHEHSGIVSSLPSRVGIFTFIYKMVFTEYESIGVSA